MKRLSWKNAYTAEFFFFFFFFCIYKALIGLSTDRSKAVVLVLVLLFVALWFILRRHENMAI